MKKLLFSTLLGLTGTLIASAQSFEGVIEFRKQTTTDTVNYIYYVKGDKVRIDEIGGKSKKPEGSFLIDLKAPSITSISHDRKVYVEQALGMPATIAGKCEVNKTGKVKTILGVKCNEYIVKNTEEKIQITYWMAAGKFDFFFKLLKVLNRKDKSAVYLQQLTGVDGMFPYLSNQISLETNVEEVKMQATKVEKKPLEASKFEIPAGYQKFQK